MLYKDFFIAIDVSKKACSSKTNWYEFKNGKASSNRIIDPI